MKEQSLEERRSIAEQKFDELTVVKRETEEELLRLQGEYRMLEKLMVERDTKALEDNNTVLDAATIVAKPAKIKKAVEETK